MPTLCEYCQKRELEGINEGKDKQMLFPDGRKLSWKNICGPCLRMRYAWEQERQVEAFKEAERRKEWHKEVAERNEARRAQIEANKKEREEQKKARYELERELAAKKMARLEAELEQLRKKYQLPT